MAELSPDIATIIDIARRAGQIHLQYFQSDLDVRYKAGQFDPVTIADEKADELIRRELTKAFPDDQIISEENGARPTIYTVRTWMVDPLDGTKEFIAGRDGFSVMIGAYEHGQPTLGVVYSSVRKHTFYAQRGQGAWSIIDGQTRRLHVSTVTTMTKARHVTRNITPGDVRHIEDYIARLGFKSNTAEGSIGLKLALLAQGQAEAFINSTNKACKWDTLAGQIILEEAGGMITDLAGQPLDYEKPSDKWDKYFVAACTPALLHQIVDKMSDALSELLPQS
jgi:3'(2'),5'-bisphosphate nucleotidase